MGYRSTVALVLTKSDYEELEKKYTSGSIPEASSLMDVFDYKGEFSTPDETYVGLYADWIKWYTDYGEIAAVEDFIRDVRHSFVRVGEDLEDIEKDVNVSDENGVDEEFYDFLSVETRIEGLEDFGIRPNTYPTAEEKRLKTIAAKAIKAFEAAGSYKPEDKEVLETAGITLDEYRELVKEVA